MHQPVDKYIITDKKGLYLKTVESNNQFSFTWFGIDALQFEHEHEAKQFLESNSNLQGFVIQKETFFNKQEQQQ